MANSSARGPFKGGILTLRVTFRKSGASSFLKTVSSDPNHSGRENASLTLTHMSLEKDPVYLVHIFSSYHRPVIE